MADPIPTTALPRGRHRLSREEVRAAQRLRLVVALAEELTVAGYAKTPVAAILKRAGISRQTFYELYDDKRAAFLDALDVVGAVLLGELEAAFAGDGPPERRARAAVDRYLRTLADHLPFARLFLVEAHAAGPEALARRDAAEEACEQAGESAERARAERDAAVAEANAGLAAAERRITEISERARAELEHERTEAAHRIGQLRAEADALRTEAAEHARRCDEAVVAERGARERAGHAEERARRAEEALAAERERFHGELTRLQRQLEDDRAAAGRERERLSSELERLAADRDRLTAELETQRRNAEITLAESREAAAARLAAVQEARDRALERAERAEAERDTALARVAGD